MNIINMHLHVVCREYNRSASVELFYDAQADFAGAPFYERRSNQLLWVDSQKKTINFLDVSSRKNRSVHVSRTH